MPAQQPNHPLTRVYVKGRRDWGEAQAKNGVCALNRWVRFLTERNVDLVEADRSDVDDYLNWRAQSVTSTSIRKDYQHLVGFYLWAIREEEVTSRHQRGPMHNVTPPVAGAPAPERTRECSAEDFATLMASFRVKSLVDCRNAAMASLMYRTGLRSCEVSRCDIDRLDLDGDPPTVEMLGKNGEYRKIPLARETVTWIERYFRRLGDRTPTTGALFLATYNRDLSRLTGRMTPRAIRDSIEYRANEQLGLDITCHQFRRAFAIEARRRGINDSTIIEIAGWQDGRMLAHYTRRQKNLLAVAEFSASDPTAIPQDAVRRIGGRRVARRKSG